MLVLPKVNRGDPMPKYLQAREILVDAIRTGQLAPGTKLPSTKELSALIDISLITAHKALEGLVQTGWLRREVGRGTYVRDDLDVSQSTQQQIQVGLLFDHKVHVNIDDYYHSTIINALRLRAREDARSVEFFFHDRIDLRGKAQQDVGAICIHPPIEALEAVERVAMQHPVVILGGSYPDTDIAAVDCNNSAGARDAVRHLLELGHDKFLLLSGPQNLSNARDRAEGALDELRANGIELTPRDHAVSADSVVLDEKTKHKLEDRLRDGDRPTAIVAGGFYLALAAMQAIRATGLSIPQDISLVGFDDPPSTPLLAPPLTTVRQPLEQMAKAAFEQIRGSIVDRTKTPQSRQLRTELIVRESTGPAPR
jgi:GntR family transcriptional regulator of arabinose operon